MKSLALATKNYHKVTNIKLSPMSLSPYIFHLKMKRWSYTNHIQFSLSLLWVMVNFMGWYFLYHEHRSQNETSFSLTWQSQKAFQNVKLWKTLLKRRIHNYSRFKCFKTNMNIQPSLDAHSFWKVLFYENESFKTNYIIWLMIVFDSFKVVTWKIRSIEDFRGHFRSTDHFRFI